MCQARLREDGRGGARRLAPMDARRTILLGVAIALVFAAAVMVVLPRPSRRSIAGTPTARSARRRMAARDVYATFSDPGPARSSQRPVRLTVQPAGDVVLRSGHLVASDAFIMDDEPFTLDEPAGRYPVSVLQAGFADGERRVAAALVRFADGDPVRWDLAHVAGQDPAALGASEIVGYSVDSGTGAFSSPEVVAQLKDDASYAAYGKALLAAMPGKTVTDPLTAAIEVDAASGANVVAFASGFGDGAYPSYVGVDGNGAPAVVLTDFGILDAPRD